MSVLQELDRSNYIYCKLWSAGLIQEANDFKNTGVLSAVGKQILKLTDEQVLEFDEVRFLASGIPPTSPSGDDEAIISNIPSNTILADLPFQIFEADWDLVGHGHAKTTCGMPFFVGCLEDHEPKQLDDAIHQNLVVHDECLANGAFVRVQRFWCHRPSCPICLQRWRARETARQLKRFVAYDEKNGTEGKQLHYFVSVPAKFYTWSVAKMKRFSLIAAKLVGFEGGSCVFHSKRFNHGKPYFSPHFHFVGYSKDIDGDKIAEVYTYGWVHCKGTPVLQTSLYKEGDVCIVATRSNALKVQKNAGFFQKNKGLRNSLAGTIFYELGHASVPPGHGHVVTWFGSLGYSKLPLKKSELHGKKEEQCPWGHVLQDIVYVGDKKLGLAEEEEGYVAYLPSREGWIYLERWKKKDPGG